MKRLSILGATGSIGHSVRTLLADAPGLYEVEAVAGGRDVAALAETARALNARFAAIADPAAGRALAEALAGSGIASGAGPSALIEAAQREADVVVSAIVGVAGLAPTVAAFAPGRRIALANKECLVAAGAFFMAEAARQGTEILPVDSEHNAIFQALEAGPRKAVEKITLTASGGPFRLRSREEIARAVPKDALKHPNWSMGAKITIDSATLMNKGLELIEAMHLFALPPERFDAVVHPESVVHGLVSFVDGSVTAGLAMPDMCVPIAHCLAFPDRIVTSCRRLDLVALGRLTFEAPDEGRFPALALARAAMAAEGVAATILNAANEVAVAAYLEGRIGFYGITDTVAATLDRINGGPAPASVADAMEADAQARRAAAVLLPKFSAKAS
ncbi:UNVERIFIED_ORG: 1-deoxy-D-xylulose-5-phosphate reductoisomerase [Xanthobacter viscosus]|uniref:1-deoxy-D-xylulose 5-phosphate reductoisomerase n=1 Tax=Xanthobacter autotrophicus TaxID=280 RepID=A0A6C1KGY1_XANAU|nr:1-deoxy-D-xylulose-5-phosphate reductoisomerase [Xanthobacter autotrophicus]TLX43532.1 1-deoxy-D-xylulose-5-phosphate reductoisomerase [Xanthobacter autotrophicus]